MILNKYRLIWNEIMVIVLQKVYHFHFSAPWTTGTEQSL